MNVLEIPSTGYGILKPIARAMTGVLIGALFLWLALRQTSMEEVLAVFRQLNPSWLAIGLLFYGLDLALRAARWRLLLMGIKVLDYRSVFTALIVGYSVNNLLPARMGELYRAHFAGRRCGISRAAAFGSIVIERALDGTVVILCLLIGMLWVPLHRTLSILAVTSIFVYVGLALSMLLLQKQVLRIFTGRPLLQSKIIGFFKGLNVVKGSHFGQSTTLSLFIWILEALTFWAVLQALGVRLGWQAVPLVLGVVSLSTLLPSAPGFVGTYQYAYAFVLTLLGYTATQGVAAAAAFQIFLMGPLTVAGILVHVYCHVNRKDTILDD